MANKLKILLLEDNPNDVKLVEYELKKAYSEFEFRKADNRKSFEEELDQFVPDIILSDFNLPDFHGLEALEISKSKVPETPFILVTGNLDDETAVSCIKLGAWDYILKGKLTRLAPAIDNAIKIKIEKEKKNKALEELKASEAKYQDLYDNAPDMFLSFNPYTGIIINCNKTLLKKLGYNWDEFVGKEIYEFYTEETRLFTKEVLFPLFEKTGRLKGSELQVIKKDGSIIDVSLTNSAVFDKDGHILHTRSIWRDITERKIMEETLSKSEEKYRTMLEANQDIIIIKSPNNSISYMNPAAKLICQDRESHNTSDGALFGANFPITDCFTGNGLKNTLNHTEIHDPENNKIYLASYFPIKNIDNSDSIMCAYKDITNMRNIENERLNLLTLLEATQNEIFIIDEGKNKFKYVNECSVTDTGYSKEELLEMSPFDLLVNFNKQNFSEIIDTIERNKKDKVVFEAQIKRKDSNIYPVEIHLQLIKQQNERLILAVIIDITERQKKEELILKLSKGIEQSPAAIVITDLKGSIEFINPQFTKNTGYSFDEVNGKNPSFLKSGYTNAKEYDLLWKTIQNGEIWHGEFLNKKKNGGLFWEEATLGPIKDRNNNITHFIGIKQDISVRKMMEEELRLERISLSKRVDERTADLSQLNAELAKAVRMKDEFLANMSHELRTPLNAILGLSEALQEEVYGNINQNQLKSLKTIEDSGRHLLSLINDILDVAKVEAGKVELEIQESSIFTICQSSYNFIKETVINKDIKYSLKIEAISETILADERRLKQILINLLSNAVKFTPRGGSIGMTIQEDQTAEVLNFKIWDTGIGISPEDLARLFKPFIQIDSSLSREFAGTGLGLTLVKSLTELHGGCVTVESTLDKGSSFTISIPTKSYNGLDENALTGNFQLFSKSKDVDPTGKIFIIEESDSDWGELPIFIDELGLEYFLKQDNIDLIENILNFKPNVILLYDEVAGNALHQRIKHIEANEITSKIPLIVISNAENKLNIDKKDLRDWIKKPLTKEKLEFIVNKYIKSANKYKNEIYTQKNPLILIAEDNENNISMLVTYLQKMNYRLITARNGNEAVSLAQEKFPDIILMDVQMPVMGGIEATKIIRNSSETKLAKVPIIALTAFAMPGDKERCIAAGMTEYIKKPISLKNLVFTIEEILSLNINK